MVLLAWIEKENFLGIKRKFFYILHTVAQQKSIIMENKTMHTAIIYKLKAAASLSWWLMIVGIRMPFFFSLSRHTFLILIILFYVSEYCLKKIIVFTTSAKAKHLLNMQMERISYILKMQILCFSSSYLQKFVEEEHRKCVYINYDDLKLRRFSLLRF